MHGSALWIKLNRPEVLNAIDPVMVSALHAALDSVESRDDVRAIVLTGAGRAFCAGADIRFLNENGHASIAARDFLRSIPALMERLESFPCPVIAAVNGVAAGGGLELVLCCDLVLAARSAKLGDAHAKYGLIPGAGSAVRLPRKIGATRAKYLLFTGALLTADEMLTAGLVNEAVPDEELEETTMRLVEAIARNSPLGIRRTKTVVNEGMDQALASALQLEALASELHMASADAAEGISAFGEKRKPRFVGR